MVIWLRKKIKVKIHSPRKTFNHRYTNPLILKVKSTWLLLFKWPHHQGQIGQILNLHQVQILIESLFISNWTPQKYKLLLLRRGMPRYWWKKNSSTPWWYSYNTRWYSMATKERWRRVKETVYYITKSIWYCNVNLECLFKCFWFNLMNFLYLVFVLIKSYHKLC